MSLSCSTFNLLLFLPWTSCTCKFGEILSFVLQIFSCGILLLVENTGEGKIKLAEPYFWTC